MQRREFLKSSATLAAGALAQPSLAAGAAKAVATEPVRARHHPINTGWRFLPRAVPGAEHPGFNDADFQDVVLPHTNIVLPWHDFSEEAYTFVSTYRRRFRLPKAERGKRVFVDFEGAMTASTVWINGHHLGEYRGGYTPFSFELTEHLAPGGDNVLVVSLDSTERADIPPFGGEVDYLTFGGIYREVALRFVPQTYIDNIRIEATGALDPSPQLQVIAFLANAASKRGLALRAEILDGDRVLLSHTEPVQVTSTVDPNGRLLPATVAPVAVSSQSITDPNSVVLSLEPKERLELWDLDTPRLYTARISLLEEGRIIDQDKRRFGLREAVFTDKGFSLNGKIVKLRGMNRHQMFPYVGSAMPRRVQRRDADILRQEYHCNIVRTSHYPQSRHFLDRCDEIGLLVLEEIPGWQHIGPIAWQDVAVDNVARMVRRDWNHPSVILWGVRINESRDDHSFYTRTNQLAKALDPRRQTGGVRNKVESELLEDVFTINDFGFPLREPNHRLYLNTEFVGHVFPTRVTDDNDHQREHTLRHARIHNQLASDAKYAGGICWCAFDYNTHASFGAGDRVCYHGVLDIFREPKPAAGFYKSQTSPSKVVVLEPAFHWARGDDPLVLQELMFCSNCEHLRLSVRSDSRGDEGWKHVGDISPDREEFPHLDYPPFRFRVSDPDTAHMNIPWGDLKVEGLIAGKVAATRQFSGSGVSKRFTVTADDDSLSADGADATRVVLRVTDEYGAARPLANDAIEVHLEGPGTLIGPTTPVLQGGVVAVWLRSGRNPGKLTLTAVHPLLGARSVAVQVLAAETEAI